MSEPAPPPSPEVAVRAHGLTLAYGPRVALADGSFEIPARTITAVIGPNGAGKSTLLHAIAGLVRPAAGSIEVFGHPPDEVYRTIGYVLQATKVNEVMPVTVREVVAMGRYAYLGPFRPFRPEDRAAVTRAMERMDILDLAERHIGELSGGQRQRVFVAQGLAQEARLLLLDEPVTGLDIVSRERIVRAIREEREDGATVVMTTHDLGEAREADHVLLLAGRVVAVGPPEQVLRPEPLAEAYGIPIATITEEGVLVDDPSHRVAGTRHEHFSRRQDRRRRRRDR